MFAHRRVQRTLASTFGRPVFQSEAQAHPYVKKSQNAETPKSSDTVLASFIWKNAEDLWGDFKHTDFGKIILPFTLLRRLECVLEPTRGGCQKFCVRGIP